MSIDRRAGRAAQRSAGARPALAVVAAALLASLALHLWGVERNLPDARDVDEDALLRPAVRIASTGNLNPYWFGYPGSTVIYPLAALLHVHEAAFRGGRWDRPNPSIRRSFFAGDFAAYTRAGRYLSVAYGVASVALAAWIAWQLNGPAAAAITSVLAGLSPLPIEYAQPLRTDSAATFYGMLHLALLLRARDTTSVARHASAGCALGLAIASRFLMASTGVVMAVVHLRLLRHAERRRDALETVVVAWLAVPVAFFVTTPYMLLAARGALHSFAVAAQKQSSHVGIDQLGFLGNLRFYVVEAIPQAIGWPQYALALLALAALAWQRPAAPLLAALYVAVFVFGLSLLGIHWQRWVVPALPVLATFTATAIVAAADALARAAPELRASRAARATLLAAATVAVALAPARDAVRRSRLFAQPSTEVQTLDWVLANVPDGASVAFEWYTAPLTAKRARAKRFRLLDLSTLARRPLHFYRTEGFEYLLISTSMYGRFKRDPASHPREVAFYDRLRERGTLLFEARPTKARRGPIVGVYRLAPWPQKRVAGPPDGKG